VIPGRLPSTQTYKNIYTLTLKPFEFRGTALVDLRDFPQSIKRDAWFQLDKVQHGLPPEDFKPMKTMGAGVVELWVRDESGAFRVVYVAKFESAIYVLHCFQKKTPNTDKRDIELARQRLADLTRR